MKFLALITSLFLFLSPVTALMAEEVETEETPIVEVVEEEAPETEEVIPGFTDEELDALISERLAELIDDSLTLVVSAWDQFITILGVSTFGGILVLIHWMLKKFAGYNGLLSSNEKVIHILTKEIAAERGDIDEMRKTFMALLAMLNIDPSVKTNLIEKLAGKSSVEEFAQVAKEVQAAADTENIEEVASLLEQVSNVK